MSKKNLNELNLVSRFVGDFFDGLSKGTSNRLLAKAKQRGFPKDIVKGLEKIEKDKAELDKLIAKYKKK
jgi:hypothetical protein